MMAANGGRWSALPLVWWDWQIGSVPTETPLPDQNPPAEVGSSAVNTAIAGTQ